MHPRQAALQGHHHQGRHQVLAEGQGEGKQHLGREGSPEPPRLWQGFAHQQGSEHQGEQDQGQLLPHRQHPRWNQGQGPGGGQEQADHSRQQGFRHTPVAAAEDPPQAGAQGQHQRQHRQGQAPAGRRRQGCSGRRAEGKKQGGEVRP